MANMTQTNITCAINGEYNRYEAACADPVASSKPLARDSNESYYGLCEMNNGVVELINIGKPGCLTSFLRNKVVGAIVRAS